MINAQTTRRRRSPGSSIRPRRPKPISATSPGALDSPIRTVAGLRLWPRRVDEPPQRRVRDPAAPARKQLMDTGSPQAVGGEPLVDLVRLGRRGPPRSQAGSPPIPRARKTQPLPGGS